MPPVEAALVVTYLQLGIQVCFPSASLSPHSSPSLTLISARLPLSVAAVKRSVTHPLTLLNLTVWMTWRHKWHWTINLEVTGSIPGPSSCHTVTIKSFTHNLCSPSSVNWHRSVTLWSL